MNERADRAYKLIDGYLDNEILEECVIDVLTDLRHLCEQEEMSFDDCLRMSQNHFIEEGEADDLPTLPEGN